MIIAIEFGGHVFTFEFQHNTGDEAGEEFIEASAEGILEEESFGFTRPLDME